MIKLAVVLPCYNEEEMLIHSTERLTKLFCQMIAEKMISEDSMIVFVNDGSTDASWQIIQSLHNENKYVCGVNLARNVGHQNAIMAGMMTTRNWADAIITIDADLQDDIKCIPRMVKYYEDGYDVVYGVKVSRKTDPFLKRLSAQVFYKLQDKLGVNSINNHADFRLMSRRALDILSTYKEHNLYLRGLIPLMGLHSAVVNDSINDRYAGVSKYTIGKMFALALDGVTAFSIKPIYFVLYIGLFFLIVALGIGVYVSYALVTRTAIPGWASLMLSVWLVGGFVMISLGIIGIYIGKMFMEVKQRPLYHVMEILK